MSNANPTKRRERLKDKTGMKFGMLTVVERLGKKNGKYWWKCKCECGQVFEAEGDSVRKGAQYACPSCTKPIRYSKVAAAKTIHGRAGTRLYTVWAAMRRRCYSKADTRYHDYGGRGITVCDRWRHSFEAFLADMGECPPGMELDRKDNDGPYSPENCRWATKKQQGRNKRNNRLVTFEGKTHPLVVWCERFGLHYYRTLQRLTRDGRTPEEAFAEHYRRR